MNFSCEGAEVFRLPDPGHPWRQILSRVPAPPKENFYIVGGWVRDLLLLGPRALGPDIDLVIDGDLDPWARSVAASFKADLRVEQGFLTARILVPSDGGWPLRIDMSRFRREWYERPGELPHVAAGSLEDDAIRRDFTMNAIFLEWSTAKKQIVGMRDPHHGLRDLREGVVHPVKPGTFREDPTRLFRWARLSVRLGLKSSEPLKKSVESAVLLPDLWECVGGARVYREMDRLLDEPDPLEVLERLFDAGIIRSLGGSSVLSSVRRLRIRRWMGIRNALRGFNQGVASGEVLDRDMFYLALFFGIPRNGVRTLMARLGLGEKMRERLHQVLFEKDGWPFEGFYEGFEKASGREPGRMQALADRLDLPRVLLLLLIAREEDLTFWKDYIVRDRWTPPLLGGEELLKYPDIPPARRGMILAELRVLQRTGVLTQPGQARVWLGKKATEELL